MSNGTGKDVMKEDDPYLQQAPQHSVRSWSDQASDVSLKKGKYSFGLSFVKVCFAESLKCQSLILTCSVIVRKIWGTF